jgi:hypothetical protein
MSGQLPMPDLICYPSVCAPGYYLILALVHKFISSDPLTLHVVNGSFGLAFVMVVFHFASRNTSPGTALVLTLPLVCSSYLIERSLWINTDNASAFFTFVCVGRAAFSCEKGMPNGFLNGIIAAIAVAIRQTNLWLVAPVFLSALAPRGNQMLEAECPTRFKHSSLNWKMLIPASLACALPLSVVLTFWIMWHGPVPLSECALKHAGGANPAILTIALSIFGGYGLFFLPVLRGELKTLQLKNRALIATMACSLAMAVIWPTTYCESAGRYGGTLWELARLTPSLCDRSLVFLPLVLIGGLILFLFVRCLFRAGKTRQTTFVLLSLLSWMICQSANSMAYQRYSEFIVLVTLIWLTSMLVPRADSKTLRWELICPACLAAVQLAILVAGLVLL